MTALIKGRRRARAKAALPGFGLTLGITLSYVTLLVLIPLAALVWRTTSLSWADFWAAVSSPRALAAYKLSFGGAAVAAFVNLALGVVFAWTLARYRFPGRAFVDALVDLPLALPTAVAGITLTTLYAPEGLIGRWLEPWGIKVAFAPIGVIVAMIFVGIPFVIRTVEPLLLSLDPQTEEAAAVLGASRWRTFVKVLLPSLWPALLTGFALAFARAVGEYGSVVFISGNMPFATEIVPLLIVTQLEQYQYAEATALALVMLAGSFLTLLAVNLLQMQLRRRTFNG
ncbi:MAG: sulfate ABC transporter permease subunit CysT [Deltaproteobacteria bacterium]|nr:sulfate ABC transporter permease subunit CysT [Deltaproteobacteria bacterium]